MDREFVALLSGGLDSVVATAMAQQSGRLVMAITFNYGQRAFAKENQMAQRHAKNWGADHKSYDIQGFTADSSSGLVDSSSQIPSGDEVEILNSDKSLQTAARVWVPNRNGLMMSWAAGIAESVGVQNIVVGFNREEAATFPDNSAKFLEAFNESLKFSTANGVQVFSPTIAFDKTQIWRKAIEIGLSQKDFWSCYLGEEKPCGSCESCQRSLAGYNQAVKINQNNGAQARLGK